MSQQIGLVLLAVVAGLVIGAVAASRHRRSQAGVADGADAAARLEARLEVQAAELRRLADAAAARDVAGEQLRAGVEGARRALQRADRARTGAPGERRRAARGDPASLDRAGGRRVEGARGRARVARPPLGTAAHDARDRLPGRRARSWSSGCCCPTAAGCRSTRSGRRSPSSRRSRRLPMASSAMRAHAPSRRRWSSRAREVAQYLDPAVTAPVAVAAVPDAAYEVLRRAHAEAYARGVVIVPYSAALPIVLFLYALVQRFGDAADVQACLAEIGGVLRRSRIGGREPVRSRGHDDRQRRRRVPLAARQGARLDRACARDARPRVARCHRDRSTEPEPLAVVR